jgi:hypothetical protein
MLNEQGDSSRLHQKAPAGSLEGAGSVRETGHRVNGPESVILN